ncbi:MAG TPA: hypothetical protein VMI73_17865 [Trebonia sp.]|nr:hypothetical protein [Trebonia sp.]
MIVYQSSQSPRVLSAGRGSGAVGLASAVIVGGCGVSGVAATARCPQRGQKRASGLRTAWQARHRPFI